MGGQQGGGRESGRRGGDGQEGNRRGKQGCNGQELQQVCDRELTKR